MSSVADPDFGLILIPDGLLITDQLLFAQNKHT